MFRPVGHWKCYVFDSTVHLHAHRRHRLTGLQLTSSSLLHFHCSSVVTDPTIRQPGFDLRHHVWSLINRFRAGQGSCRANLLKWGLAQSPPVIVASDRP